ncbi:MFS transporter [Spirillospora sp. CA-255316]
MAGETLTGVYSSTKGAATLVAALLVQDGALEPDEPVARRWPVFAAAGKDRITLRDVLTHRSGVIGVDGGLTADELADDRVIADRLAGQRPYWRPGSAYGYGGFVAFAIVGEVVRKATGRSLQEIFEERVRAPYELDLYLGLPLTSYALAFGGMLLAGGRAGDLFGRRRLFRAGLVVFLPASLLGGAAQDGGTLIAARVLQGVGGALIAPAALSLLADTFPAGPERNRALGVYGAMGGLGSVVGLLLGGALTEYLGWRWIMFVNVPFALAVLAGTLAVVPGTRRRGGLDLPGAITVTLALASLVYAINRAG